MRRRPLHIEPTTLDVMEHVLDKGVVVERNPDRAERRGADVSAGIGVFGVDVHVEIATDLDDAVRDSLRR